MQILILIQQQIYTNLILLMFNQLTENKIKHLEVIIVVQLLDYLPH